MLAAVRLAFAVALVAMAAPAHAQDYAIANPCDPSLPVTQPLDATTNDVGIIHLYFFFANGATVKYYECHNGTARPLGTAQTDEGPTTLLNQAAFWRCDRVTRNFAATAILPDGSFGRGITDVRTTSCAHRFVLNAPVKAKRGVLVRTSVLDTWGLGGLTGRLCIRPPHRALQCRKTTFRPRVNAVARRWRFDRKGRWQVVWRTAHARLRTSVAVGVKARKRPHLPTVLATGDSTMIGVGSFLADDLSGTANVAIHLIPGIGISSSNAFLPVARKDVKAYHPKLTFLSIGANEGFPLTDPDGQSHMCCTPTWSQLYAQLLKQTVDTYLQHGRGKVILFTIQLPRDAERVPIFQAANDGIDLLEGTPGVTILHLDKLFTPNGYTETIDYEGKTLDVREPDGIHLNVTGTSIAARAAAALVPPLLSAATGG